MKASKVFIFLNAFLPVFALSDEEEWLRFKVTYRKSYASDEEEQLRFRIFQENLKKIRENNALFERREISYALEVNKFADVSREEFKIPLKAPHHGNHNITYNKAKLNEQDSPIKKEPDRFDWRERGAVSSVVDERSYYSGYSWAFAVVAALETQVFRSISYLIPLSAQQLVDCAMVGTSGKYYLDFVYEYVFQHGIFTEEEYPYSGSKTECQDGNTNGISMAGLINMDEESDIKLRVFLSGTVVAVIDGSGLLSYGGGIVDGSLCSNLREDLNHLVLIVGYDTDEDFGEYWIVKNSWGADWGEDGYFRLARLKNNTCGVGTSTSLPII